MTNKNSFIENLQVKSSNPSLERLNARASLSGEKLEKVPTIGQKFENWWQKSNATYYRDNCYLFGNYVFSDGVKDFEGAFGTVLDKFYLSHGRWKLCREFPEIHDRLVSVNVRALRETWNNRNLDLKSALLDELRLSYTDYASQKNCNLYGIVNDVIPQIWLVNEQLFFELPVSVFPISYPNLANILVSTEYCQIVDKLNRLSKF